MEKPPVCHGIIPARYGSSRFPGKALTDILGKPMFWHVWHRASLCPQLASVTLATDDERIAGAASALGVPWVMTSKNHESGTDRVYEAARLLDLPTDAVLVNIQGDEPALSPAMLGELVQPFFMDPSVRVTTLARSVGIARTGNADRALSDEINSPDRVKVVFARNGDALYFSRLPIPFERDADSTGSAGRAECICRQDGGNALSRAEGDGCEPETTFSGEATSPTASARTGSAGRAYVHIGLYAFRYEALAAFTALPKSRLEGLEKLEQLRFLENGIPIRVVLTEGSSLGVDRPEDLPEVLRVMGADAS